MNAIYILWLRQVKKYFRSRARLIGSLGQPILFLVALGFGFGPIYAKAGGGNYIEFIVPGIIAMAVLFTSIFMGIEIIWDRQFGFLKETLVAPVSRFNIMLGRTLGGATVASFQGILVFLISFLVGFRMQSLVYIPLMLVFLFLTALFFTAVGTVLGSVLEDMQGFQVIINFLVMPLFFLSGALFPLQSLPQVIKIIAEIDPLTYGVDGLRRALTLTSHFGFGTNFLVLVGVTLVALFIGSYFFKKIQA